MPVKQDKLKSQGKDGTFIKALGLAGMGGVPCAVDVKDGKVVRIRPLHFEWKWDRKAGLIIQTPDEKPCEHAFTFKIERKHR